MCASLQNLEDYGRNRYLIPHGWGTIQNNGEDYGLFQEYSRILKLVVIHGIFQNESRNLQNIQYHSCIFLTTLEGARMQQECIWHVSKQKLVLKTFYELTCNSRIQNPPLRRWDGYSSFGQTIEWNPILGHPRRSILQALLYKAFWCNQSLSSLRVLLFLTKLPYQFSWCLLGKEAYLATLGGDR